MLTPDGFRPIGALAVGDLVIGSDGKPTPVLGVYPQGEKDIYRVTAQDGASTLASGDHLWAVATRDDRRRGKPLRVLTTREMIGNLRANHYHRYELPLHSAPVRFPYREVPMDPYALGLLLGDGCLTGATTPGFATGDPELAWELQLRLPGIEVRPRAKPQLPAEQVTSPGRCHHAGKPSDGCGAPPRLARRPFGHQVRAGPLPVQLAQGPPGRPAGPARHRRRPGHPAKPDLPHPVHDHLAAAPRRRDLPGPVAGRRRLSPHPPRRRAAPRASLKGRPVYHRHDAHIIDIRLPEGIEPFRLTRKRDAYNAAGGGGRPMRFIESIEPAGTAAAVCIAVAAADSLYTTEDFLLTHNTLNDSFIILDEAQNTSAEQMKMFLTRLGFGSQVVVTGDITQVDLPTGQVSGLRVVQDILDGVEDIHFARLTSHDVVRHRLVGKIVDAYERYDAQERQTQDAMSRGARPPRRKGS